MSAYLSRRQLVTRLAAGAAAVTLPLESAWAQSGQPTGWPTRPVRFIIPAGAGGQTDLFARWVADHLSKVFGQPFIADNRPGGSGNVGTMAVVNAPADGHSVLFTAASFSIVPAAIRTDMPYDLLKDLAPVVQMGVGGQFLVVAPDLPVQSVNDLIELARKEDGKLSYASNGVGSTGHLIMASVLKERGLSMNHVAYRTVGEILRDLMGGVVKVAWVDTTNSLGPMRSGAIRVLAHGATERAPLAPEIPPLKDVGIPWDLNGWIGLFVRAGTSMSVVNAINAEISKLLQSEEGKAKMKWLNAANPVPGSPEEFAAMIRRDLPRWRKIAQDNQINPQS